MRRLHGATKGRTLPTFVWSRQDRGKGLAARFEDFMEVEGMQDLRARLSTPPGRCVTTAAQLHVLASVLIGCGLSVLNDEDAIDFHALGTPAARRGSAYDIIARKPKSEITISRRGQSRAQPEAQPQVVTLPDVPPRWKPTPETGLVQHENWRTSTRRQMIACECRLYLTPCDAYDYLFKDNDQLQGLTAGFPYTYPKLLPLGLSTPNRPTPCWLCP
ncbi:hypothetical protein EV715DRAFT_291647 [Schizophyllum commune]